MLKPTGTQWVNAPPGCWETSDGYVFKIEACTNHQLLVLTNHALVYVKEIGCLGVHVDSIMLLSKLPKLRELLREVRRRKLTKVLPLATWQFVERQGR